MERRRVLAASMVTLYDLGFPNHLTVDQLADSLLDLGWNWSQRRWNQVQDRTGAEIGDRSEKNGGGVGKTVSCTSRTRIEISSVISEAVKDGSCAGRGGVVIGS